MDNHEHRSRRGEGYHMKKHRTPKDQHQQKQTFNRKYPDRWQKYPPLGVLMPDTRFIAFKTPLSNHFFEGKDDIPFMIPDIIKEVEQSGKKLGLVFDLTATTRYYESSEWSKYGVKYEKIFCQGHNIHQQANVVEKFISIVDRYFESHKDEKYIVGVHCTHGINRTGFLICRYLMARKGWDAAKAIASFEASRGIKIERSEYINSLLNHKISGELSMDQNPGEAQQTTAMIQPGETQTQVGGIPMAMVAVSVLLLAAAVGMVLLDPVEEKKCQDATTKLRGLLHVGDNFLPSKK